MSATTKKQRKAKPPKARPRTSPLKLRSDNKIAEAALDQELSDHPPFADDDKKAFDTIHMEMKKMHPAELPVHVDIVERAAELRWRLRKINAWENQLFTAMTRAVDLERPVSPNMEKFTQILDTFLRNNILEKVAKYEAAVREQVRKSDQDLRNIEDWHILTGLKRGEIGYTVAHNLFSETPERLEPIPPDDSSKAPSP